MRWEALPGPREGLSPLHRTIVGDLMTKVPPVSGYRFGMEVTMSSTTSASVLPEHASIEQLRKQAKELRRSGGFRTLAEAQSALAGRYGFTSWPKLRQRVGPANAARPHSRRRS